MSEDLRDKLRRLGIHKGAAELKTSAPRAGRSSPPREVQAVLGGRQVETPHGPACVVEKQFDLDSLHGHWPLSGVLGVPGHVLPQLAYDPHGQGFDLSRAAFIDTETTGLAGGTGTLAFLVGVGKFQLSPPGFQITQFFLRQPDEEAALLAALDESLAGCSLVVTFNGRGFDMPLLQARFTLNRMAPASLTAPHLDLLLPSRRVWRDRLPSCALSSLEEHVLGVRRDQADVPGFLIPSVYFDYLKTGDAEALPRVLYHNVQDILSMVTLLACLGRILADPLAEPLPDPADLVSLARWYEDLGQSDRAEAIFRRALEHTLPPDVQAVAWRRLGGLLKQQGRYEEARLAWEQLAGVGHDITAHVELAKHYEWRARRQDIGAALHWTQAALKQVETWPPGYAREQARAELVQRQRRLRRKHAPPAPGGKTGRLPSERRQKRK